MTEAPILTENTDDNSSLAKGRVPTERTDNPAGHTPGPWRIRNTDATFRVEAEKELLVVSTSWHSSIRRCYPLKNEAYANARLIAAAPALLEALLAQEDRHRRGIFNMTAAELDRVDNLRRAALAQAQHVTHD